MFRERERERIIDIDVNFILSILEIKFVKLSILEIKFVKKFSMFKYIIRKYIQYLTFSKINELFFKFIYIDNNYR